MQTVTTRPIRRKPRGGDWEPIDSILGRVLAELLELGKLPEDLAVQLARQGCAPVARKLMECAE